MFCFLLKIVYCVCSLESPHRGDSNDNTQHTIKLEHIENISLLCLLAWRYDLTLMCSILPCLEHIFMIPKVFEPLKIN